MKLLLVTGSLNQGGSEYQLLALAKLLLDNGIDNEVYAITNHTYYLRYVKENGIKYSCNSNKGNTLVKFLKSTDAIIKKKPDVVISFNKKPGQVAIFARIISGFRFKVIISERTAQVRPLRDLYYFNLARLASYILVNSKTRYCQMRDLYPFLTERTLFIPNILDTEKYSKLLRTGRSMGDIWISYVGRIAREKNIINLIKGFGLISHKRDDISLSLIGQANDEDYLKEVLDLIGNLNVSGKINYLGPVSDIDRIYSRTDLLCLVSFYEGLSNTLAEGMAAGIPVLASDIEPNRFLVEDGINGFLVNPEDINSIAAGIERFLNSSAEVKTSISINNKKKTAEIFDRNEIVKDYLSILTKL